MLVALDYISIILGVFIACIILLPWWFLIIPLHETKYQLSEPASGLDRLKKMVFDIPIKVRLFKHLKLIQLGRNTSCLVLGRHRSNSNHCFCNRLLYLGYLCYSLSYRNFNSFFTAFHGPNMRYFHSVLLV